MSSVEILLEIKKINTNFHQYLMDILYKNDKLKNKYANQNSYIIDEYSNNITFIKEFVERFLIDINNKIESNTSCIHDFEEDDIDITPDLSKRIIYCKKCEKTF